MTARLSLSALADLERLELFLASRSVRAASRANSKIIRAIDALETFPHRGRPVAATGLRELWVPFGRAGYVIRYASLPGGDILVIRIWHSRERRP